MSYLFGVVCSITTYLSTGHTTDVAVCLMQGYIMADHYENVNHADYDVVRSTQFADDMSCGVCVYCCMHFRVE